jgi:hypothetical protein
MITALAAPAAPNNRIEKMKAAVADRTLVQHPQNEIEGSI